VSYYVGKLWQSGQGDRVKWQVLLWLRWPPKIKSGAWPRNTQGIFRYWIVGPIEVRHFLL
jgi:hypothetical protein